MANTSTKPYKWNRFKDIIENRAVCDNTCKYFQYCPLTTDEEDHPCDMAISAPRQQRSFFNLFLMGDRGLKDEFFESLFHVGAGLPENDTKLGMSYLELLQKAKRMFYDKEKKEEKDGVISFKVNSTQGCIEAMVMSESDVIEQHDQDSLYASSVVDELFSNEDDRD